MGDRQNKMYFGFLNPQGNFDPQDSYWMEHPDFGGQLVYVKETALAIASLGHKVDIITRQIHDPDWPEFSALIDHYPGSDKVRIVRLPCGPDSFLPKEELWPYLGTDWLKEIVKFYEEQGGFPDVFTTHYGDGGLVGALINKEQDLPFTFTAHSLGAQKMDRFDASEDNLEEFDNKFHFARRIQAERVAMNRAHQIITSTRQEMLQQYSHPAYQEAVSVKNEDKFSVIPPGVNRDLFNSRPGPKDEEIASRIHSAIDRDLPPGRRHLPLVLCSSRLDRKKNHIGLVNAFATSEKLKKSANLAIVARGVQNPLNQPERFNGESRKILEEMAHALTKENLWNAVTSFPLEDQQELAGAYRWCAKNWSVFSLISLYEPFGLAPLEAMSCGTPVVVTNRGGPTESLIDQSTEQRYGILVDPQDPHEVASGLLTLTSSKEQWKKYHKLATKRIKDKYTWKQTAKKYVAVATQITNLEKNTNNCKLRIPQYFTAPNPENDISLESLQKLYFNNSPR